MGYLEHVQVPFLRAIRTSRFVSTIGTGAGIGSKIEEGKYLCYPYHMFPKLKIDQCLRLKTDLGYFDGVFSKYKPKAQYSSFVVFLSLLMIHQYFVIFY